jgi:hypothetical protein
MTTGAKLPQDHRRFRGSTPELPENERLRRAVGQTDSEGGYPGPRSMASLHFRSVQAGDPEGPFIPISSPRYPFRSTAKPLWHDRMQALSAPVIRILIISCCFQCIHRNKRVRCPFVSAHANSGVAVESRRATSCTPGGHAQRLLRCSHTGQPCTTPIFCKTATLQICYHFRFLHPVVA